VGLSPHRGRKSGRKSGTVFVTPLLYMFDGPNVEIGADRRSVRAVTAGPDDRARLWPDLVELYADFDTYQSWTDREIPVVVRHPR
jgi:hypothetical protein